LASLGDPIARSSFLSVEIRTHSVEVAVGCVEHSRVARLRRDEDQHLLANLGVRDGARCLLRGDDVCDDWDRRLPVRDLVSDRDVPKHELGHRDRPERGEVGDVQREHHAPPLAGERVAELDLDAACHRNLRVLVQHPKHLDRRMGRISRLTFCATTCVSPSSSRAKIPGAASGVSAK
jgi:hypothetical protein